MRVIYAAVTLAWLLNPALAADFSPCTKIITDGLREYNVSQSSSENLDYIYERYCRSDASSRDSSWNASLSVVVYSIPIGLSGGSRDAQTAVANFCKNYTSTQASKTETRAYSEKIVARAYDTFDTCMRIAANDINIYHTFNGLELANIYIAASITKTVQVDGLSTSGPVACFARGTPEPLNDSSKVDVSKTLNIVCRRQPQTVPNSPMRYEEAAVTLSTNVGPYEFTLPAVPADYAIKSIELELKKDFDSQLAAFQSKVEAVMPSEIVVFSPGVSVGSGGTGVATIACPAGWIPKEGAMGPQPDYQPFGNIHVKALSGGYVVDANNHAGDQRGAQLLIAQAKCTRPALSSLH